MECLWGGEEGGSGFGDDLGGLRARTSFPACDVAFSTAPRALPFTQRERIERDGMEFTGTVLHHQLRGHRLYYA